jgi:diguanylate cyclase (GGDEF)-like protein
LGWKIVVRQPLDAALKPIHDMRLRLLGLGLGAVVLFVLVAFRLARVVSRPIEQLAQAARQVERREGAPQFPRATRVQEIAQLSQSMQAMTQSLLQREEELKTINQTLEQQVRQRTASLETVNRQLEQLATRDALTGLHNRRSFDAKIADYVQIGKRSGRGFAILMIDADHFKRINDTHGHSVGDAVLQQLAQLLTEHVRATDFVARYGGEEFVVLLPDSVQDQNAKTVAEKIRVSAEQAVFPTVGNVTVSIGVSHWSPSDTDLQTVFKRADQALYDAKAAGRNQVVVSGLST